MNEITNIIIQWVINGCESLQCEQTYFAFKYLPIPKTPLIFIAITTSLKILLISDKNHMTNNKKILRIAMSRRQKNIRSQDISKMINTIIYQKAMYVRSVGFPSSSYLLVVGSYSTLGKSQLGSPYIGGILSTYISTNVCNILYQNRIS